MKSYLSVFLPSLIIIDISFARDPGSSETEAEANTDQHHHTLPFPPKEHPTLIYQNVYVTHPPANFSPHHYLHTGLHQVHGTYGEHTENHGQLNEIGTNAENHPGGMIGNGQTGNFVGGVHETTSPAGSNHPPLAIPYNYNPSGYHQSSGYPSQHVAPHFTQNGVTNHVPLPPAGYPPFETPENHIPVFPPKRKDPVEVHLHEEAKQLPKVNTGKGKALGILVAGLTVGGLMGGIGK